MFTPHLHSLARTVFPILLISTIARSQDLPRQQPDTLKQSGLPVPVQSAPSTPPVPPEGTLPPPIPLDLESHDRESLRAAADTLAPSSQPEPPLEADEPEEAPREQPTQQSRQLPLAHRPHFGLSFGTGAISSGDLFGLTEFAIQYSTARQDDIVYAFSLSAQDIPLSKTTDLNASLRGGLFVLGVSADARWYRTPHYTFIGHYLSAGVGLHLLFWSYKNELVLPHYDEDGNFTDYQYVSDDYITALDLHGGIGLNLGQVWALQLEGELSPGVMFSIGRTNKGFENDVFKPFLYLKFRLGFRLAGR